LKYYKELALLGCFTHSDLVQIVGSYESTNSLASKYLQKGYIERIRRDLYAVISMETGQPIPTRYKIATRLAEDACVSHHSAFEFYGFANQVFYEIYVTTNSRFRNFEYDGVAYRRLSPRSGHSDIKQINGVRVTSVERTVIDSISDMEKIGGLEETLRCIQLIPSLNPAKLLSILAAYDNGFLYQKTGYILEALNDDLRLPHSFFEECQQHSSNSKMYLSNDRRNFKLHEKWKLYALEDLKILTDKGVKDYDAV
jgi:predicted transcriptional regulator of viral defense system